MFRSVFMNQYRNKKLPESFHDKFTDISNTDTLQTRHNDYNYQNIPAVKKILESFPYKCMIRTWNHLSIDVKSTSCRSTKIVLFMFSNMSNPSLIDVFVFLWSIFLK